ncbi:D-alanyl-D-alanine carboxypeptidase/D-alanyl-D-alanine-endopeptidase [Antarcticibacterium flavum]|uniref:D-alanyl-D-alanine carboxypeptidase/D-alanyl-D-alanine-endopeptidase n=1 Tax=Antarcticibacterium flavum TaxID=2058175 RepID=A0A5B7X3D1_9FLAO|nr:MULTISPECIES: D-alanyl-D-alanine carboxypeptidase/D-alanyl-D-alanine-endopeptidase [Antarcticibacterium]MCM4160392.1 D-alanyl-D-alanine carboxypeptidase/D-alanyl-D-alanine-endopeptidase [Antarcticibacterium sp. W02-3]QCY69143.1 D-alanyl-D-alanine carboxypeptidase/D-alanyl-D-alanine-endopeptidase [Antarcticibacterium flavum]
MVSKFRISRHTIFLFFFLSFLFLLFSSCSSTKIIDRTFKKSPSFEQGFAGLAVYDLTAGKMIYEHNASKYFTPASNIKLFSLYTGLKILGDSVPALKYEVRGDSVIFKGTGDPSFLNPDLQESKIAEFLRNRSETLYYFPPSFTEKYFGPGWSWDDYNSYYSVERSSFPVYGNRISVEFPAGAKVPRVSPGIFKDSIGPVTTSENFRGVRREMLSNKFSFDQNTSQRSQPQQVPVKYSPELLVNILRDTLQKEVVLLQDPKSQFRNPKTLYSLPVDSIYRRMMEVSDNFIAEQILLLAAGKIADTLKTEIAIAHMLENHLQDLPDEPQWVDGSGLSRYNLVTPRTMVALLRKIKAEAPVERLFGLMATGGVSGTLKNNYAAATPYIFAKTGTLRNNHSLSGFLRAKSGKILAFSFMNSNYVVPTSELKENMEVILKQLYERN